MPPCLPNAFLWQAAVLGEEAVTFLFTDVDGSTRLLNEHGDGYAGARGRGAHESSEAQPEPARLSAHLGSAHCRRAVVAPGNDRKYDWEYGALVSVPYSSLQFATTPNRSLYSAFPLLAVRYSLFSRTFDPKAAGSSPARPTSVPPRCSGIAPGGRSWLCANRAAHRNVPQAAPSAGRGAGRERSTKIEDQLESVADTSHLVEGQVCDLSTEGARIDCADHLAHDACLLVTDRYLGMEACWWRRGRGRTDDDGRK